MIRFTSEDLRRLEDAIEFEQPCAYAECNSNFYRVEEVKQ